MALNKSRIALSSIFFSLFLLGLLSPVCAMGSRENPLAMADNLIKEKKYDEAVLLLTDFIKDNPERFDQAQARLRRIIEIRNAYNKRATQLLDALIDDPRNQDKHLALIRELETLEPNPNPEVKQFVEDTKLAILFTVNRIKLEDIMTESHQLADRGRFVEAADHYTTGFDLYKPEFESGTDRLTITTAFARVNDVKTQISRFAAMQTSLNSSAAALKDAFTSGNPARVDAALPAAENALASLANLRAETLEAGRALERQFALFQKADPTLTDSSFLPFAFRFILGRTTEPRPEGVAGAMASQWAALFDSSAQAGNKDLENSFAAAEKSFSAGDFPASNTGFTRVQELSLRALRFQGLWSIFLPTDVEGSARAFGKNLVSTRGAEYLRIQHLRDTSGAYAALASLRGELVLKGSEADAEAASLGGIYNTDESRQAALAQGLSVYRSFRARSLEILALIQAQGEASRGRGAEVSRLSAAGFVPAGASDKQAALDAHIAQSATAAKDFETRAVALSAKTETDILSSRLEARKADIANGRRYLEGIVPEGSPPGTAASTYPTRSIRVLSQTDQALKTLRKDIADLVARYSSETPYVASAPSVVLQIARAKSLDASAAKSIDEGAALMVAARDRQRQAQSNKLEADLRLQEARAALAREDFDTARERLDRARERYLASLSFEDDADVRAQSDRELEALGTQIVRAENDRVVRDTRRLLTTGKTLYNQAEFARSEEALLQARARWKVTHTDELEPEVEYWLRLVQTALSVKTGRDIPQTAPLYPEMSQLLSLAKKYFEEGKAYLDARDKVSALNSFALSKKKIQEVKVVFPLNQDARVLELRINQVSDPAVFNQEFARLVSSAKAKVDAKQDLQTVYSDLLDLQAIDSKYPGLSALIERLEILIGMRLPPPDPKALAEARTLAAAAQRTFDSREVAQFPTALAQLNRALELDPNNETASRLKDRILTYVGGTATLVLPRDGEVIFNEAVTYFQNGDYLNARLRLARLYVAYPQARKVQKASDLDARLTARGY